MSSRYPPQNAAPAGDATPTAQLCTSIRCWGSGPIGWASNLFGELEAGDVFAFGMTRSSYPFQTGVVVVSDPPVCNAMTVPVAVDDDVGGTNIAASPTDLRVRRLCV